MSKELFPGFKVPPVDPSRDIRLKVIVTQPPIDDMEPFDDFEEKTCKHCDGWGYADCFCGGDPCCCGYNGERPCYYCA